MKADLKVMCDYLMLNNSPDSMPEIDREQAITSIIADIVPIEINDYSKISRKNVADRVKSNLRQKGVYHDRVQPEFSCNLHKTMFYNAVRHAVSKKNRHFVGEQLSTREIKYLLFMDTYKRKKNKKDFYNNLAEIILGSL